MHDLELKQRRRLLTLIAAGGGAAALGVPLSPLAAQSAKPRRLVVNASGGVMGQAVKDAYGSVFTSRTGIPVEMSSPPDLGKLRAMVQTRNIEWDVTEINSTEARLAGKMGLLEPIDPAIVDRSNYPADARDPFVLTSSVYSTLLAYRQDAFPEQAPKTWADFWDVKKFPGPRSMWNSPIDNLEFALIADGVAPKDLYPLDVDRAFRKLDQIREHVTVWWTSGAQQVQLLVDREVALSTAWNGRMYNAIQSGAPIGLSWDGAVIKQAYFGIPKGVAHPTWSQQFLSAMTDPKAQAIFANQFVSSGLNPESLQYTEDKVRPYLPTEPQNLRLAFWQNDLWWNEHILDLRLRWQRWMLS